MVGTSATKTSGEPDALAVYARRRARMIFLRRRLEDGHPVLATESQLVDMARSKLMEALLSQHGEAGVLRMRPEIEDSVRFSMRRSAPGLASEGGGREQLLADIESEPLDSLFHAGTP